jgi:iron complex outermembrane receptor protein
MKALLLGAATGVSMVSFLAGNAAAADAASAPTTPSSVQEVVVTAQRRQERLESVPIAVTALNANDIKASGIKLTTDLDKVTPGLLTTQASGFFVPYIRGIGAAAITPGNESTVATYVDGVYLTDKQSLLLSGFSDVQDLEVLRGPQGTLFGRNATAGAVIETTRGPSDHVTFNVEGTAGNAEQGAKIFLAGPIAPTLSGSIAAFYLYDDPYIKNVNPANGDGSEIGSAQSWGVRGKLRWQPTANFSAVLAADYGDSRDQGPWAPQAINGTPLTVGEALAQDLGISIPNIRSQSPVYGGSGLPLIHYNGYGVSLTMEYDTPWFDVKSITAHREDHTNGFLDLDATPLNLFYFTTDLQSNVWQEDLTFSSKSQSPLSWVGGVYLLSYRDGYANLNQNVGIPYPYSPEVLATLPAGSANVYQSDFVTIHSLGVFGDASYNFTHRDKLTLGLRFTDERDTLDPNSEAVTTASTGEGTIVTLPPTTFTGLCAATPTCHGLSTPFSQWTWRVVYDHNFTDDVMAYVSYNRGFKSGVYNISTISAATLTATSPETVDAYEVGLKSQWLDRRLTVNVAAYYNKYNNLQVAVSLPPDFTEISENAAKAATSGLEVEATLKATERLTLMAGGSVFFEAKYTSFPNCSVYETSPAGGLVVVNGDCTNKGIPGAPDTFDFRFNYRLPLNSGATLSFDGLYSYASSYDFFPYASPATRAPQQAPVNTVNLSVTWRGADRHLYLTAWGRNLANQTNIFRGLFQTPFGFMTTYARGATGGLTVGYDY